MNDSRQYQNVKGNDGDYDEDKFEAQREIEINERLAAHPEGSQPEDSEDGAIDLVAQEMAFIGQIYADAHPDQLIQLLKTGVYEFKTPIAKRLWEVTAKYHQEYEELPLDRNILATLLPPEYVERLVMGIELATDTSVRARFIRDTFKNTIYQSICFKRSEQIYNYLATNPAPDVQRLRDMVDGLTTNLACLDEGGLLGIISDELIVDEWSKGRLTAQKTHIRVPLDGPSGEDLEGTPVGSVNVVVAPYGGGKSTFLANLAAEWTKDTNVLYVTLELPQEFVEFKALANVSDRQIRQYLSGTAGKPDWVTPGQPMVSIDPRYVMYTQLGERGKLTKQIVDQVIATRSSMSNHIYYLDMPAGTVTADSIGIHIKHLKHTEGIEIQAVVIDYAALMRTNSGKGKDELGWGYAGAIVTELTALAHRHNCVIWTAAQAGGEAAHTVVSDQEFKPIRGASTYGSKEVLQTATMVLGMSVLRSTMVPGVGVGLLTTIKNRYGSTFFDYLFRIDYRSSTINVVDRLQYNNVGDMQMLVWDELKVYEGEIMQDLLVQGIKPGSLKFRNINQRGQSKQTKNIKQSLSFTKPSPKNPRAGSGPIDHDSPDY